MRKTMSTFALNHKPATLWDPTLTQEIYAQPFHIRPNCHAERASSASTGPFLAGSTRRILSTPVQMIVASLWLAAMCLCTGPGFCALEDASPVWEPLLWGGPISESVKNQDGAKVSDNNSIESDPNASVDVLQLFGLERTTDGGGRRTVPPGSAKEDLGPTFSPTFVAPPSPSILLARESTDLGIFYRGLFRNLVLKRIPPLYLNPELPGEGVWDAKGLPTDQDGRPLMYKTSYRPSEKYPNATAHMLLFDMKRLGMKLYLGSAEPGGSSASAIVNQADRKRLVALTNALWKQKHSGDAGTIVSGRVIKDLYPGMATLVMYTDGSVDILEWSPGVPNSLVRDAKQLRHLIVRDGKVVDSVISSGQPGDSEIGLGFLLSETEPMPGYQYWQGWFGSSTETTSGPDWFIATRSAYGIRRDGNLVFAIGHHISTKDLAKALVLAGCERAIHADANPHNVVANIYFSDGNGNFLKKDKLSPDQKSYTLDRYVDRSYTSDFYCFFSKID